MNWRERLARELSGAVLFEEPLAKHTTYKIGGPAEVYARPSTLEGVRKLLQIATEAAVPVFVIGEGSNLLVSDAGVRGVVLDLQDAAGQLVIRGEEVEVGAGLPLQQMVETTARAGLAGLENLAGIPGTVGGAVVMNAGAFGTEFFDLVSDIDVMTSNGEVQTIQREQLDVGYRRGYVPADGVILAARLRLRQGKREVLEKRVREILARREAKQPLEYPSCGSVFKRPPGDYAGRLIEACGCKGLRIGNAQVSEKHANFIINLGGATAEDVLAVIREVRRRVADRFGVLLEPEVRFVGFDQPVAALLEVEGVGEGEK